jgi:predicted nucleic acid-binding Zn ribbon protein
MTERTDTSCPRCGAAAERAASRCGECGFAFFEERERRRLPRPSPLWLLAVAACAVGVVLLTRDSPPEPPAPVAARIAAQRLATDLRHGVIADLDSVRCPGSVAQGRLTRCQARYTDGDTQLLVVTQTADGELDIQNPYPAQRRPGG